MSTILKVENLTKIYNGLTAVDNISFEASEGEIVGLVGPNGAGKTTIIQILLSLLEPTAGKIEIFEKDFSSHRQDILSNMNFVAPYASLPYNMTVRENLLVFAMIYGVQDYRNRMNSLIEEFELAKFKNNRSGSLSSGEQTRLGLAKAFLNNPKLLLLDEPTSSLDPAISNRLREKIHKRMKAIKGAVLWTSHDMREIETVCDRVIFLFHGKIVASGTPKDLQKLFNKKNLEEIFLDLANKPKIQ